MPITVMTRHKMYRLLQRIRLHEVALKNAHSATVMLSIEANDLCREIEMQDEAVRKVPEHWEDRRVVDGETDESYNRP